jgi:para-aminobenzoate synthetase/4-amino-4-deoxychorismate lyase
MHESRAPLVLTPACSDGWFNGVGLMAVDPEILLQGVPLKIAGAWLDRAMAPESGRLVVCLLDYEGEATVAAYGDWREVGADDVAGLLRPAPGVAHALDAALVDDTSSDMDGPSFGAGVREVHEAIRRGDVYVLNLTYRLQGRATADPAAIFATLMSRSRAGMGAYWRLPGRALASASPERFLSVEGRAVEVHPVKGTRPRGADARTDAALAKELAESAKERSEHVMIVDLERNDLGRVCRTGTVEVDPLFEVVTTPYCHQLVSRVKGELRPDAGMADLLAAAFPCGSVTGAPKIAAMEHIERLESSPRGAYTGALIVAVPGRLDSSVLIRTADMADEREGADAGDVAGASSWAVSWGTGGGITIDSDPAEEYMETLLKASPLLGDGAPPVGLLETCRVAGGEVPLWPRHKARLAGGGCGPSILARLDEAVAYKLADAAGVPRGNGRDAAGVPTRLRVIVTPEGTVAVSADDVSSSLDDPGRPRPVAQPAPPSGMPDLPPRAAKPADRAVWDEAQARARAEVEGAQAVLVDAEGLVIDGAIATVWAVVGGRLVTPPAPPAVAGVARGAILEMAATAGLETEVRGLRLAELAIAEEVFFTNALAGAVEARGRGGPVTVAVAGLLDGLR